jgi:hypothetical protein
LHVKVAVFVPAGLSSLGQSLDLFRDAHCPAEGPSPDRVSLLFPDNPGPWETCPGEPLEGGREVAPRGITRQQHQEEDGSIKYRCQEPCSSMSRRGPAQPALPRHCQAAWPEGPDPAPRRRLPHPKAGLRQLSPGSTSSLTFLSSGEPGSEAQVLSAP